MQIGQVEFLQYLTPVRPLNPSRALARARVEVRANLHFSDLLLGAPPLSLFIFDMTAGGSETHSHVLLLFILLNSLTGSKWNKNTGLAVNKVVTFCRIRR